MAEVPEDLRQFLSSPTNRQIKLPGGEVRELSLFATEELAESTFTVGTSDFALQEGWASDPERKYPYRGVDLVKECNSYDPRGILVWFPTLGVFGSWDCDHHKIMVFPEATWSDILKEPSRYFNAQWYPEQVRHVHLRPWEDAVG